MPSPNTLWDLIDQIGITILGTSPKGLQAMEEMELVPMKTHKLQTLHTILSTGAPLTPKSYEYVYKKIKQNVLLGSISGGSDIIACFAGQNPTIPVYSGEIQSIHLGMAVECWNDKGIDFD
jgi:acetoacetyl-CoA synthetase